MERRLVERRPVGKSPRDERLRTARMRTRAHYVLMTQAMIGHSVTAAVGRDRIDNKILLLLSAYIYHRQRQAMTHVGCAR